MSLAYGVTSAGEAKPLLVDSSGRLAVGGGGGVAPPTGDNTVNTGTTTSVASVTTVGGVRS